MSHINKDLQDFYASTAKTLDVSDATKEKLSAPLLVKASAAYEDNPEKRILVIGKETHGWGGGDIWNYKTFAEAENGVQILSDHYSEFTYSASLNQSPFWQAVQAIAGVNSKTELSGVPILWSDLMATDYEKDSFTGKLSPAEEKNFVEFSKNKFLKELSLLKPKVCVLFTGPTYDPFIKRYLNLTDIPANQGDAQPFTWNGSTFFRTYHPNYLQQSGKWSVIETLAKKVQEVLED